MRDLKKALIGLAEVYGVHPSEQRLQLYAEALADLPLPAVQRAILEIMRDPTVRQFPLPAVIRERITPGANTDHEAIEAVNRIVEAMSRFGYGRPRAAREFIGEIGWLVVQRNGGWESLCESVTMAQLPMYRAQWRELAKALIGRAQRGEKDPPQLPRGPDGGGNPGLGEGPLPLRIGKIMKDMGDDEGGKP